MKKSYLRLMRTVKKEGDSTLAINKSDLPQLNFLKINSIFTSLYSLLFFSSLTSNQPYVFISKKAFDNNLGFFSFKIFNASSNVNKKYFFSFHNKAYLLNNQSGRVFNHITFKITKSVIFIYLSYYPFSNINLGEIR